jgi:hypothetical protein
MHPAKFAPQVHDSKATLRDERASIPAVGIRLALVLIAIVSVRKIMPSLRAE